MLTKTQKDALQKERKRKEAKLPPCPTPIKRDSGCKVAWYFFATKAEAEIASQHAKVWAEYKSHLGYDYGFYACGEINESADGTWRVVFP
jgi:hypothetical protein